MTGAPTRAIHVRQKPCTHGLADADNVSAFPLSFSTFQENINTLWQTSRHDIPSTVGVLGFENPIKKALSLSHVTGFCIPPKSFTYLIHIFKFYTCVFPVIIHAGSLFFALKHAFSDLLYIPNYDFWIIRMCFLLFCTYLIPVFELFACISYFFAHT